MKVSELPYRRVTREEMTDGLQRVIERVKAAQSVEEILAARAEYLSLTTLHDQHRRPVLSGGKGLL